MKKLIIPCNLYTNPLIVRLAILVVAAALSGCGGGGGGGSSSSPVAPIDPSNTAPTASPISVFTNENTSVNGALVASDADGDPLTYSIATNGSIGTVKITNQTTGAFTYTPDPGESGTDNFTFKANDGSADSNVASVTVTINLVNAAPIATGGCSTTPQNLFYPGFPGKLSATDPDADLLLYSLNADGSGGAGPITTTKGATVTIDQTTGDFHYLPDISAGDKRGRDSFDYQVSDPDGAIDSATETVIVEQTVMPLGDSITVGDTGVPTTPSTVGYRLPLYDALITSEYRTDFVGTGTEGSAVPGFDYNHEGHGGWTAFDLAWGQNPGSDGVFVWLDRNPADIVLLHAGTNDVSNTDQFDIADILNEIDRWENSAGGNPVTVILARIIDQDPINPDVTTLNTAVETMAQDRINAGDDIIIVDQQNDAGLVYTIGVDMGDRIHPNANGYVKMKNVWLDALTNVNPNNNEVVLDKCP